MIIFNSIEEIIYTGVYLILAVILIFYICNYILGDKSYIITGLLLSIYFFIYYENIYLLDKIKKNIPKTKIKDLYNKVNTGDFVFYKTKKNTILNTGSNLGVTPINFLGFTHISMIIKDDSNKTLYSLESTFFSNKDYLENNDSKSGVMVTKLEDRIDKNNYGDIIVITSNLHKFITFDQLITITNKYIAKEFLEDFIYCTNIIYFILADLNILDTILFPYIITLQYFIDPSNYKVNVQFDKIITLI